VFEHGKAVQGPRNILDSVVASIIAAVVVLLCFLSMVAIVQRCGLSQQLQIEYNGTL
jgi:hypothetical protein